VGIGELTMWTTADLKELYQEYLDERRKPNIPAMTYQQYVSLMLANDICDVCQNQNKRTCKNDIGDQCFIPA
jgi:hypothetical protein